MFFVEIVLLGLYVGRHFYILAIFFSLAPGSFRGFLHQNPAVLFTKPRKTTILNVTNGVFLNQFVTKFEVIFTDFVLFISFYQLKLTVRTRAAIPPLPLAESSFGSSELLFSPSGTFLTVPFSSCFFSS